LVAALPVVSFNNKQHEEFITMKKQKGNIHDIQGCIQQKKNSILGQSFVGLWPDIGRHLGT